MNTDKVTQHAIILDHIYEDPVVPSGYTDEQAQDAVGAMVDSTLVYTDGTPLLSRAALTGDVTASAGSNATTIANDAVTFAKMQNVTGPGYVGRTTASSGDLSFLSFEGSTTLSAAITALTPTAYWRLNDSSGSFQDSAGGGYHMTLNGSASITHQRSALLPQAETRYARFAATTGVYGSSTGVLGMTMPLTGSWSFCALCKPIQTTGTASRYLLDISAAGETEAANYQVLIYITSDRVQVFWEFSAGTNVDILGPSISFQKPWLIHIVKDTTIDTIHFYLNGAWAASTTYANEPSGGSTATTRICGSTNSESDMIIGEMAFFNGSVHTQTQAETLAKAAGLMGT